MTRVLQDIVLRRVMTLSLFGLFAHLAVIGLLLFGPRVPASHQVRVEPGGKVGLRAAVLRVVTP